MPATEVKEAPIETVKESSPKSSPTKKEVDVTSQALNFFAQGKRHLLVNDVASAVNSLQEACRLLAENYGETAKECADAYYYYGRALLELARIENGVLGNALDGVPEGDDENNSQVEDPEEMTDKEKDEVSDMVGDALEKNFEEIEKIKSNGSAAAEILNKSFGKHSENEEIDEEMKEAVDSVNGDKKIEEVKENGKSEENKVLDKTEEIKEMDKIEEIKEKNKTEAVKENVKAEEVKQNGKVEEVKENVKAEEVKENGKAKEVKEENSKELEEKSKEVNGDDAKAENVEEKEYVKEKEENASVQTQKSETKEPQEEMEVEENKESPEDEKEGDEDEDQEEGEGEDGENEEGAEEEKGESVEDDDVDNLQLAWEMLETSKVIYNKQLETAEDKAINLKLSQTYLKLGEVGLESENYQICIEDFKECLKIQTKELSPDDRSLAETHYQIGISYSLLDDFDQAIESFKAASTVLETRISNLKNIQKEKADWTEEQKLKDAQERKDPFYNEQTEIEELEKLLPEMKEKVVDMQEMKKESSERIKKIKDMAFATLLGGSKSDGASTSKDSSPFESPFSGSSMETDVKPVSNIGHLMRKKRKPEDEPEKTVEVKRPKEAATETKEQSEAKTNGNGEAH